MAWSNETNRRIGCATGGHLEVGYVTLSAAGTVEIPTEFSVILAVYATYKVPATGATLYSDGVITAGCVTLTDSGTTAASGATVWYMIAGY